jgi:pilus assembly protein CpaF
VSFVEARPLIAVERAVQARAKEQGLAVDSTDGAHRLTVMVAEEIERWRVDHRRGVHDVDIAEPDVIADRALRNLTGYGPLDPLLADDDVWEIMINSPASVFVKRHNGQSGYHDEVFHDDDHVVRVLTKMLDDASGSHRKLDPAEGLQDAQLGGGARLHIVHGDLSRGGHTMVNIRKYTGMPIRTLGELVSGGTLDLAASAFLSACVRARLSILFAGAPGAGKTTLLSCCAAELDPSLRVCIAEEVFEADVPLVNVAQMQTRAARSDRPAIDLRRLVAGFLRMAPDIAIVGEVRDREVLPLLLTLSSGVKGYTTIHAGSARQALTRLRFLAQLADTSSELPLAALNALVCEAVDVVVHVARTPHGPRVTSIICVEDLAAERDSTTFTVTEVFGRATPDGPLTWTGHVPARASSLLAGAGVDARSYLTGVASC